eukprot:TRINITY_DN7947_c0_g1_i1.p2 TRINITY_DN7947_c0_g1~~TRINITY_DN7947_c0_g1_i1.p2  ORF type:complete len:219 (-),score=45.14 TRINITY_DN7947_c0_g1_i1:10-645(-)
MAWRPVEDEDGAASAPARAGAAERGASAGAEGQAAGGEGEPDAAKVVRKVRTRPKLTGERLAGPEGLPRLLSVFERHAEALKTAPARFDARRPGDVRREMKAAMRVYRDWGYAVFAGYSFEDLVARIETLGGGRGTKEAFEGLVRKSAGLHDYERDAAWGGEAAAEAEQAASVEELLARAADRAVEGAPAEGAAAEGAVEEEAWSGRGRAP